MWSSIVKTGTKVESTTGNAFRRRAMSEEIKPMLSSSPRFKVSWVRRSANVVAYKLAKVRIGEELCEVWLGVPRLGSRCNFG